MVDPLTPSSVPTRVGYRKFPVRPSIGALAVGGGALVLAGVMFWQALSLAPAADAYRQARPCAGNEPLSGCYQVEPVTIQGVQLQYHKGGASATVAAGLPTGTEQVHIPSVSDQNVLVDGATGTAKIYQGQVTLLILREVQFATDQNPLGQQSRDQSTGVIALLVGGVMLVADQFRKRRKTANRAAAAGTPGAGTVAPPANGQPSLGIIDGQSLGLPIVIKPNLRNNLSQFLLALTGVALAAPILLVQLHLQGQGAATFWTVAGAVVLLLSGLLVVRLMNMRLVFDGLTLQRTGTLGQARVIQRDEVGRFVLRTVVYPRNSFRRLVVVGKDGRALLIVDGTWLNATDVAQLAGAMNVPSDQNWDQEVSPGQLRQEFPGSASWFTAHAWAIGVLLAGGLIAVVTAVMIVSQSR